MQMWLYCFQAWTGTSRQVCRASWNLRVWVSTQPHALLCSLDVIQHSRESVGQEMFCRLGKPPSCLFGTRAIKPFSEKKTVFPTWVQTSMIYLVWGEVTHRMRSLAGSSPRKKCVITSHVRYIARVHYIKVVLNKILQKESSGKQGGREGETSSWFNWQ